MFTVWISLVFAAAAIGATPVFAIPVSAVLLPIVSIAISSNSGKMIFTILGSDPGIEKAAVLLWGVSITAPSICPIPLSALPSHRLDPSNSGAGSVDLRHLKVLMHPLGRLDLYNRGLNLFSTGRDPLFWLGCPGALLFGSPTVGVGIR
jgi:hypothetical protein